MCTRGDVCIACRRHVCVFLSQACCQGACSSLRASYSSHPHWVTSLQLPSSPLHPIRTPSTALLLSPPRLCFSPSTTDFTDFVGAVGVLLNPHWSLQTLFFCARTVCQDEFLSRAIIHSPSWKSRFIQAVRGNKCPNVCKRKSFDRQLHF